MQEYSVRVTFLELYNEELFDLLSSGEDSSKIRIFEDSARKVKLCYLQLYMCVLIKACVYTCILSVSVQ